MAAGFIVTPLAPPLAMSNLSITLFQPISTSASTVTHRSCIGSNWSRLPPVWNADAAFGQYLRYDTAQIRSPQDVIRDFTSGAGWLCWRCSLVGFFGWNPWRWSVQGRSALVLLVVTAGQNRLTQGGGQHRQNRGFSPGTYLRCTPAQRRSGRRDQASLNLFARVVWGAPAISLAEAVLGDEQYANGWYCLSIDASSVPGGEGEAMVYANVIGRSV
jgi:hypothetical protein